MKILAFLVSLAIFLLGLYLMGAAFYVPGYEGAVFIGGILCVCVGFGIPVHVLKRVDG